MPKILQSVNGETTTLFESGFPIGFVGNPQENPGSQEGLNYIYNHINIKVSYHTDADLYEGRRIVGFEVEPESITHSLDDFSVEDPKQVGPRRRMCTPPAERNKLQPTRARSLACV